MRMSFDRTGVRRIALAALGCLALAGTARAQGDGPHNLPLVPKGMNLFVAMPMGLSGNFNPSQTVLIPGANVDVFAVPVTYIRTFSLGGRFGRLFLTAPFATLDASGTIIDPRTGNEITVSRGRSGWMDPMVTMHVGLVGAPALAGADFVKHPSRSRWSRSWARPSRSAPTIRRGRSTSAPTGGRSGWASARWRRSARRRPGSRRTPSCCTPTTPTCSGRADTRSQDPLFISENHFTHAFNPKWWGSVDLRWQYGGETHDRRLRGRQPHEHPRRRADARPHVHPALHGLRLVRQRPGLERQRGRVVGPRPDRLLVLSGSKKAMKKAMTRVPLTVLGLALGAVCATTAGAQEILPFPPTPSASTAGLTMKDSTYKKRVEPKHLAEGAPNILIILMDDVGPATPSTYGGEINTPTLDRVAKLGISFNRFHSTAMCSPTRAALLTGRNHTFVGNGQISAIANDFDGFSGTIPKSSATVAEVLKDYGYNTGAWGKWHNTPEEQITSQGAVRVLADRLRLRVLLRIPRRRGLAVRADPDPQHHAGHRASPQGLPPHRRHRVGRDHVAPRAEGLRAGEAVLHVLGAGRVARPAPDHEGMGRQVQGQVRRRLGQVPRARLRARQGQGLDPAERPAHAAPRVHGVLGLDPRGREAVPAPPDGGLRRLHRARRLQRRPGHRRDREARASSPTR